MHNHRPDSAPTVAVRGVDEAAKLDTHRLVERSSTQTGRDRSWTAEFEVRYLTGTDGDRLAVRQADAIAALLTWVVSRESGRGQEAA